MFWIWVIVVTVMGLLLAAGIAAAVGEWHNN